MKPIYYFLVFVSCICLSCAKKSLPADKYIEWIGDDHHGLKAITSKGDYVFCLLYKPNEYFVLESNSAQIIKKEEFYRQVHDEDSMQYFTFFISTTNHEDVLKHNISTVNEYYRRIEYFSHQIQNDLTLIEDGEILPCKLATYERDYDLSPFQRFVLAFRTPKIKNTTKSDKILVYHDEVLGMNDIEMTLSQKNLKKIPRIKL